MLKYNILSFLFFLILSEFSFSQDIKSIHQEQAEFYSNFNFKTEKQWNALNNIVQNKKSTIKRNQKGKLIKQVFGWNPYWMGTAYYNYDYSLLSEVSYFSYEVNSITGYPDDIHYWKTTFLVDSCHNNNVKISLTATLFSGHQTFFESPIAVDNFIDTIIKLVQYRNADGINIDFEAISSTQKTNLTNFIKKLSDSLHTKIPNSHLSIAIPAVDWSSTFDVAAMNNYIDLFLIMGYEYYWSGSTKAGPGSPKNSGDIWTAYNTTKSINDYLNKGIPKQKLCLAVPYYGREWSTTSNSIPSNTTAKGSAVTYSAFIKNYLQSNTHWDYNSSTPVNIYYNSEWKQCWQNDAKSLGYKYDYIKLKDIAGIGIWALGYDGAYSELWDMLSEKFTTSGNNICEDYFSDTGGPLGQYYNNENWTFIIAPQNANQLKMVFSDFDVELNYDTLFIYDGLDTLSNLIGSYTGTNGPQDTLIAYSGAFTFRFISDNATVREGWNAHWTCDSFTTNIKNININIKQNIYIFPNPFTNNFSINLGELNTKKVEVNIFNLLGQNVLSKEFSNLTNIINIQTDNLSSNAIYILQIKTGNQIFTKKIIKK